MAAAIATINFPVINDCSSNSLRRTEKSRSKSIKVDDDADD